MSDYLPQELPVSLVDYRNRLVVAGEVGHEAAWVEVTLRDGHPDDPDVTSMFLRLSSRQARDLAETVFAAAQAADRAVEVEQRRDVLDGLREQHREAQERRQEELSGPQGMCPGCLAPAPLEADGITIAAHRTGPFLTSVPCLGAGQPTEEP